MIACDFSEQMVPLSAITYAFFSPNTNHNLYLWKNSNSSEYHNLCKSKDKLPLKWDESFSDSEQNMLNLSQSLPNLQFVSFVGCKLNNACCKSLAKANLAKLDTLIIKCDEIGNEGLQALMQISSPLYNFDFSSFSIKKYDIDPFQSTKWSTLETLRLENCHISRKGVKNIVKAKLKQLRSLNLNNCNIDDEGLIELSKSLCKNLRYLNVEEQPQKAPILSNRGWKALRYGSWKQMRIIIYKFDGETLESLRNFVCSNWSNISNQQNTRKQPHNTYYVLQNSKLVQKGPDFFA